MKEQKSKQVAKPYHKSRPSRSKKLLTPPTTSSSNSSDSSPRHALTKDAESALPSVTAWPSGPIRPWTPPATDSTSSSPRLELTHGTRPLTPTWTSGNGLESRKASEVDLQEATIPGYDEPDTSMLFRIPRTVGPIVVQGFAQGTNLGGNNTCFKDFEEAQTYLTKTFTTPEGVSYLDKINASFAKFWSSTSKTPQRSKLSSKSQRAPIQWNSSKLTEYLFFLFLYFVPRKSCFGTTGGQAQAFGLQGGLSRDRVIELLMSTCTGVIFDEKSVSSHAQQIRIKLGGRFANNPRRQSPEYLSVDTDHGFAGDFPGDANPMSEQLQWTKRYYKFSTNTNAKENMRCPLILPPVLAAILEPAASSSDIDVNRMRLSFNFAQWSLPADLQAHWQEEKRKKEEKAAAVKAARDLEKAEREGQAVLPALTKRTYPASSHIISQSPSSTSPATSRETSLQYGAIIVDDRIRQGVQLDPRSRLFYPRYYQSETLAGRSFQDACTMEVDFQPVPLRAAYIHVDDHIWPTSHCRGSSRSASPVRFEDHIVVKVERASDAMNDEYDVRVTYPDSD